MMEKLFFPTLQISSFFLTASLSLFIAFSTIPCSPPGHEVEIQDELRPQNKKKRFQHHVHIELNLPCFVGSG
jgi:hypothetical protein